MIFSLLNNPLTKIVLNKARYRYANIDRYVSLKQSELKRDIALNSKV